MSGYVLNQLVPSDLNRQPFWCVEEVDMALKVMSTSRLLSLEHEVILGRILHDLCQSRVEEKIISLRIALGRTCTLHQG